MESGNSLIGKTSDTSNRAQKLIKVDQKWVEYAWNSQTSWRSNLDSRQSRDSAEKKAIYPKQSTKQSARGSPRKNSFEKSCFPAPEQNGNKKKENPVDPKLALTTHDFRFLGFIK